MLDVCSWRRLLGFCNKRCGPSRRRALNASLRNFVRHPKKTFATLSGVKRTHSRHRGNDAIDLFRTCGADRLSKPSTSNARWEFMRGRAVCSIMWAPPTLSGANPSATSPRTVLRDSRGTRIGAGVEIKTKLPRASVRNPTPKRRAARPETPVPPPIGLAFSPSPFGGGP
jgi:hypothetical protein